MENGVVSKKRIHEIIKFPNISWTEPTGNKKIWIFNGSFESPLKKILPEESHRAHFQLILPKAPHETGWKPGSHDTNLAKYYAKRPICILFGPTGDHSFSYRRTVIAEPLAKAGIGSIILQNPFYGERKPQDQIRSRLRCVSDLMTMGSALVGETNSLLLWLSNEGFGPFATWGYSMGGQMAGFCSTMSPFPTALIPCMAPYSAVPVYSDGIMHDDVAWDELRQGNTIQHAKETMERVLNITDLKYYPQPLVPEATIIISGKDDCYVPGAGEKLHAYWPGSEHRMLEVGHVTGMLQSKPFVTAIVDGIERLKRKS